MISQMCICKVYLFPAQTTSLPAEFKVRGCMAHLDGQWIHSMKCEMIQFAYELHCSSYCNMLLCDIILLCHTLLVMLILQQLVLLSTIKLDAA